MVELVEFLTARLNEDERAARAARPDEYLHVRDQSKILAVTDPVRGAGYQTCGITSGRVLREVEAKRRIIDLHERRDLWAEGPRCPSCSFGPWPCDTMRALASAYSDHPDHQKEWDQ